MSDTNITDTANAVKGVLETDIAKAALLPPAKEIGAGLALVAQTTRAALAPLKAIVWISERFEKFIVEDLTPKLEKVPAENIVTPKVNVAGPAFEALRFSGEEPEIRDLFAQLLATSMDKASASTAHPGFVEVIKQMTPDEARILKFLWNLKTPHYSGNFDAADTPTAKLLSEGAGCEFPQSLPTAVSNLVRLGLVVLTKPESSKTRFTQTPSHLGDGDLRRFVVGRSPPRANIKITPFGKSFAASCFSKPAEPKPSVPTQMTSEVKGPTP